MLKFIVCIPIIFLTACTPSQAAVATSALTPTSIALLTGDPRTYLPDLSQMPAGYFDASGTLGTADISRYGGKGSSISYGKFPSEAVLFVAIESTTEAQAEKVFQQVSGSAPDGIPITGTGQLAGFDEYKIVGARVGANGYIAFLTYRYLNVVGAITTSGAQLSEEMVIARAIQFAKLIPPKLKK